MCFARKRSCIVAAKANDGFSMEAYRLDSLQMLHKILHEGKVIGDVQCTFCDCGLDLAGYYLPTAGVQV